MHRKFLYANKLKTQCQWEKAEKAEEIADGLLRDYSKIEGTLTQVELDILGEWAAGFDAGEWVADKV